MKHVRSICRIKARYPAQRLIDLQNKHLLIGARKHAIGEPLQAFSDCLCYLVAEIRWLLS
jgi:hypothetical protein